MPVARGKRIGGRGCPACGSHDTEGLGRSGAQWCNTCAHRWLPCSPGCRGYRLYFDDEKVPYIAGCEDCGVPDKVARQWPEAWRAMAHRLDSKKLEAIVD
jgi:hypothetical protein